jgi:hypothetical protein
VRKKKHTANSAFMMLPLSMLQVSGTGLFVCECACV